MDNESIVYFYFNTKRNLLEITHEKIKDKDSVEIYHISGKNTESMKDSIIAAILCFNMGRLTKGKGEISVEPIIAITYLKDLDIIEVDELKHQLKDMSN